MLSEIYDPTERRRRTFSTSQLLGPENGRPEAGLDGPPHQASLAIPTRSEESPPRNSFSSSLNHKTPVRSFFHRSVPDHQPSIDFTQNTSLGVREETAELASQALSDIASHPFGKLPSRRPATSPRRKLDSHHHTSDESGRPEIIPETSEPPSPQNERVPQDSHGRSALADLLRPSPSQDYSSEDIEYEEVLRTTGIQPVIVRDGIISQPNERTSLLLKKAAYGSESSAKYGSVHDLEEQRSTCMMLRNRTKTWYTHSKRQVVHAVTVIENPKKWDGRQLFRIAIQRPASYIPPVILGLLLNILDALSYGMILFPLGEPLFAQLGPDGISMFYVSCIVSQLVYSLGGSIFKGGIGSEMIEVVPFFHKMAFTILNRVGRDNPEAVLATTIFSYSISSLLTGLVFFLMGYFRLGALIGFFPRHILIGCIGGIGWFLVATGLEVSARLDGNLDYNMDTLRKIFQADTVALWTIPLALAVMLLVMKRRITHPLTDATFFLAIIAIFYLVVLAIPNLQLPELRSKGWMFEAPDAGVPFYHFYSLYNLGAVDWAALGSTVPAMLALTFFGVLHVPINVPALALSTGEDAVDLDRELRAHGISNALSGLCGSVQNYLVYTNTLLFMRSGGDSRFAGVLLAAATFGILVTGPVIIGFIPIMVVGALIFFLGIDLMIESLVHTWGKVNNRIEYFTIVIIVVTMGAWDFVIGILVGILLACVSFVLQASQVSAIRGKLYGGVANSTVRRHAIQHRFLQDAGQQIYVMKLAGYLFFGTIVGVENQIRRLLQDSFPAQPIRFLVLDLYHVDGVDFSAAEAFTRINRILSTENVQLVVCGLTVDGEVRKSFRKVGLFDEGDGVEYFVSLNSALEHCENELLKAFYQHRDAEAEEESSPTFLEVPRPEQRNGVLAPEAMYSSPRKHHLVQVATTTLNEQDPAQRTELARWQDYSQPLQLILQTFSTVSDKPEDFWYPAVAYFTRQEFSAGSVLYDQGDESTGFYLLESGMLKAKYDLPQGKYSELIVAGTTCGELPFFSSTSRTATTYAERDSVTWMLDREQWQAMQAEQPQVAQELLTISLKLTSERMDAVTKYMLLTSG